MTPNEATRRIIKSRRVLTGWRNAHAAGDLAAPPGEYVQMIASEIEVLEAIAAEFPNTRAKLETLTASYRALAAAIRGELH